MADSRRQSMGATIRTIREAVGLTRKQLHDRSGVSVQMIAKVEQGHKNPSPNTLRRIAEALELEPTELARRASAWEAGVDKGLSTAELRASTLDFLPEQLRDLYLRNFWESGATRHHAAQHEADRIAQTTSMTGEQPTVSTWPANSRFTNEDDEDWELVRKRFEQVSAHGSAEEKQRVRQALGI